ncbi:hypothetical protein P692DRAFT_201802140 [Suillus brevipes Sb2]|nr:hypothetical protein P692DRAFT_201802140 [Suillus brevipes Sb2]
MVLQQVKAVLDGYKENLKLPTFRKYAKLSCPRIKLQPTDTFSSIAQKVVNIMTVPLLEPPPSLTNNAVDLADVLFSLKLQTWNQFMLLATYFNMSPVHEIQHHQCFFFHFAKQKKSHAQLDKELGLSLSTMSKFAKYKSCLIFIASVVSFFYNMNHSSKNFHITEGFYSYDIDPSVTQISSCQL